MNPEKTLCSVTGCPRQASIKHSGECTTHYSQRRKKTRKKRINTDPYPKCLVSHCKLTSTSSKPGALCKPHRAYKYSGGDPEELDTSQRTEKQCAFDSCKRIVYCKGLCSGHYTAARRGRISVDESLGVVVHALCEFDPCLKTAMSETGYCEGHRGQLTRTGTVSEIVRGYAYGEQHCIVPGCSKLAESKRMCRPHVSVARTYRIDAEQIGALFSSDVCFNPGCESKERLRVDHSHTTGNVRGRLCHNCNVSLGLLKEDKSRIMGLITYIESEGVFQND